MKTVRVGQAVLAAIIIFTWTPAIGYAQSAGPKASLAVYDGKNREVGKVVGFIFVQESPVISNFAPVAMLQWGRSWFPVAVFRNRLVQLSSVADVQPALFFESADCTGTPYVQILTDANSLIPRAELIVDKLYVQNLEAGVKKVSVRSLLVGAGKEKECSEGGGDLDMAPATMVDFQFAPPFIIR